MSGDNYLLTYLIMPKLSIEILLQSFLLLCVHRPILQCTTLSRGDFFNKKIYKSGSEGVDVSRHWEWWTGTAKLGWFLLFYL